MLPRNDIPLPARRPAHRIARHALTGLLLALAAVFLAAPSPAAAAGPVPGGPDPDAPRGWSFWQSDGTAWLTAGEVSADSTPKDGATIGWRFAATPDGVPAEAPGGDIPVFEQVCKEQAAAGKKRVAVAVDFGDAEADAYPGETPPASAPMVKCVVADEPATALQILGSVATARVDQTGRVLTVNGYPAKAGSAGQPAPGGATAGDGQEGSGGLPMLLIIGAVVVIVAAGATAWLMTRRKSSV
ncbi:hypothetical protein HNP84_009809 [Thermocatellispora tengchongensis]|uniref:Uncharacterized protein n=1 Tax=Thermocatellispora tengchongensis TaxID=1073253 RepID=A0A840PF41_9ACTN|nr:SCO2322 family protein [Thermocatellispora tengchongensis]MBB5140044.1 hypothetical protein [Thermocatellispora tengchongensis]